MMDLYISPEFPSDCQWESFCPDVVEKAENLIDGCGCPCKKFKFLFEFSNSFEMV